MVGVACSYLRALRASVVKESDKVVLGAFGASLGPCGVHQLLDYFQILERVGVGSELAYPNADRRVLLGRSHLEMLGGRGVNQCGDIAVRIVSEARLRTTRRDFG